MFVVNVDPERVPLALLTRKLDEHADAVIERQLVHQLGGRRLSMTHLPRPRGLGHASTGEAVGRRGCLPRVRLTADNAQRA
jgi:hypothetical protein